MGRSGYSYDCDDNWAMIRYRGMLASAVRGKRGQAFFRDLVTALDEMPQKRLIRNELLRDGEVCAVGALWLRRVIALVKVDAEDRVIVACVFDIALPLARDVVYMNDEYYDSATPEERWTKIRAWAESKIKKHEPGRSSLE